MLLSTHYKIIDVDEQLKREIQEKFKIPSLFATLISERIEKKEDAKYFFSHNLQSLVSSFYFTSMIDCVNRLNRAIEKKENVYIFGDRDADGITSAVLIHNYLVSKGLNVQVYIPSGKEFYGFSNKNYDDAKKSGVSLVITTDTGITFKKEVNYGAELGIDTIVLDHHECKDDMPDCIVVNPKFKALSYPFFDLSAAGVVAKVIWANEFSRTSEFNKERVLFSSIFENNKYVVSASTIKNFVESEKETCTFSSKEEFKESKLYQKLSCKREIFVYKQDCLSIFFTNVIECKKDFAIYIPSLPESLAEYYKCRLLFDDIHEAFVFLYKTYILRKYPNISSSFLENLDLVAISTIADMMPLTGENRILTFLGLEEINKRKRINLQGLLSQNNLVGAKISSTDIAFSIAPVINSAGRLGKSEIALNVFLQRDTNLIDIYTRELLSLNAERQNLKTKAFNKVKDDAEKSYRRSKGRGIFVVSKDVQSGIAGLLASAFANEYRVSCMVVCIQDNAITGSLRIQGDVDALALLSFCKGNFEEYGGHNRAAGFRVKSIENIKNIEKDFFSYLSAIANYKEEQVLKVDARITSSELDNNLLSFWDKLQPFGSSCLEPVFLIEGLYLKNAVKFLGKNGKTHLSLSLASETMSINAIMWNNGELIEELDGVKKVNVLAKIELSFFRMSKEYKLIVFDIERA